MRLIAKFAWIALPALAGCGMLSQVSSQGTGTNPGGKTTGSYPPSWVQNLRFPEERDFLADAGLSQYKKYADYIKPNVGVPESKLGMTMLQFREIEKVIAQRVLSRKPKEILDRIKKDKYGIIATTNGAPVDASWTREGLTASQRSQLIKELTPDDYKAATIEAANIKKVPASINSDVSDYVLSITDSALVDAGIDIKSNKILRAKAFAAGSFYFTAEAVVYEDLARTFGPLGTLSGPINSIGAFVCDRPRGVCDDQAITLIFLINSKSEDLGLKASYYVNETATSPGNKPTLHGFNHAAVIVENSNSGHLEGYDVTKKTTLDTYDMDARALWATGYNGAVMDRPYHGTHTGKIRIKEGDPFSTFDRGTFQSLGSTVNNSIRDAMRR